MKSHKHQNSIYSTSKNRAIKLIDNNPFKQHSSDEPKQEYDVSSGFDTASVAGLRIVRHEDNSMLKNTNYNFKISSNKQNTLNSKEENMNGRNRSCQNRQKLLSAK